MQLRRKSNMHRASSWARTAILQFHWRTMQCRCCSLGQSQSMPTLGFTASSINPAQSQESALDQWGPWGPMFHTCVEGCDTILQRKTAEIRTLAVRMTCPSPVQGRSWLVWPDLCPWSPHSVLQERIFLLIDDICLMFNSSLSFHTSPSPCGLPLHSPGRQPSILLPYLSEQLQQRSQIGSQ